MESPVMTSASSHRLRSAVSACAQPTHSYLNSSYLSTSIQVESHNSGGCLKKFHNSGKNGESSPTTKSHSTTDYAPLHKRYKTCARNALAHQHHHHKSKFDGDHRGGPLGLKPFTIGNDLLSKLTLRRQFLDSSALAEFRGRQTVNGSVNGGCEKVTEGKSGGKSIRKNASDGVRSEGGSVNGKVVGHRGEGCSRARSKKRATEEAAADDSVAEENELNEEWSKRLVAPRECLQRHVVTRRRTPAVREFRNVWQSTEGLSKSVPAEHSLRPDDLEGFPSIPKVIEMLECSKEYSVKPPSVPLDFYNIREESRIKQEKVYKVSRAAPTPRILDKNEEKRPRKSSKGMSKYEVFLGGSCNPTTWRTDFAIPELERMGISYYNPHAEKLFQQQVEEWRSELMEVEYHAKENATVMFFVLDNQTRGVSALIEVAHLAGNLRKLILVVQSFTQKNQIICDERISEEEYEDLKTGQEVLQDLMERQGIPVFSDMKAALECTEKVLREGLTVQDVRAPVEASRGNPISSRDVFDKLDANNSGEISASDSCLGLKMLTGVAISESDFTILITKTGKDLNGTLMNDVKLDFECFSKLVSEFKTQLQEGNIANQSSISSWCCRDVYLGGTIENTSWRESIAVPILEEHNLSFFVPKICEGGKRFTEIEAAAMENSFVLFFAITNTARSIAAMAIAGHYIGKRANVVLCVEQFPEKATVAAETLSEIAVKDYNRGRMYLMDIAERKGVRVFTDISTAVKFVTQKCRNR